MLRVCVWVFEIWIHLNLSWSIIISYLLSSMYHAILLSMSIYRYNNSRQNIYDWISVDLPKQIEDIKDGLFQHVDMNLSHLNYVNYVRIMGNLLLYNSTTQINILLILLRNVYQLYFNTSRCLSVLGMIRKG